MKRLILPLVLLSTAALALAADAVSVTGKWHVHGSIAGTDIDQNCTFTQKDADLTGSCTSDKGTVTIAGKLDGNKVSWSYKSDYQGTPITVKYDGTVDASSKIAGSVSVPEFSVDGDFTATQSN